MNRYTKDQMTMYISNASWELPSIVEIDTSELYYDVKELKDYRKALNKLRFVAKQTDDSRRVLMPYIQAYGDLLSSIERVVEITLEHGAMNSIDSNKLNLPALAYDDDEEDDDDDEEDDDD